jgi:hypothetical protein
VSIKLVVRGNATNEVTATIYIVAVLLQQTVGQSCSALECTLKPMIAKPRLIAKAFSGHARCAALAKKKKKNPRASSFRSFFTRAKDDKSQLK